MRMSCEHTTFSLVFVNMPTGKRLRSQTKEVVVNVYEYFEELGRRKRTEGSLKQTYDATISLIVPMTISCRHSQSSFFVEKVFFKTMVAL